MRSLAWWLRIVGVLYLLEGGGLSLIAFAASEDFAAIWASVPASTLDEVAVRGMLIAGLPAVLTWVLLGALMLVWSRTPARAGVLVVTVAAWELLVWAPTDLVASFHGFTPGRTAALLTVHVVIGASGLLLLRRAQRQ